MQYLFTLLSLFLFALITTAQTISYTDQDRLVFDQKIAQIHHLDKTLMGKTMVAVGNTFKGAPYVAHTLEINEKERLVINLQEFDCTTYIENVLAFSLLLKKGEIDFDAFTSILQNIRYRDGELEGYSSRLNYFSEWLLNNELKGLIQNITSDIGGHPIHKKIHFMSSHRELYPMLKEIASYESIKATESVLSQKTMYIVPQDQIKTAESLIEDGDIIALATSIEGLDVTHTGFAVRKSDGHIHLLHASASGQVEITEKPLTEYLKGVKNNTGIIVARPL